MLLAPLLAFLLPAFELITTAPPQDNDSDPVIHREHNKFSLVKHISKRDVVSPCPPGKHQSGDNCCDFCKPGYVIDKNCTTSSKTICKICREGEEYMDHPNYLSKCIRCSSCDPELGFEVDSPCYIFQNVKCRCKHGFFCNSSEPSLCRHCDPCTKCEDGIVVEECTPTSDTTCQRNAPQENYLWIIGIVILLMVIIACIIWCTQIRRPKKQIEGEQGLEEMEYLRGNYPDIDLTPHITDIAEVMTVAQVTKFVRKQGLSNPAIEKITLENINNASEQKIKLLDSWYQEKGRRGAYETLICSLKDLKQRVLADRIVQMMAPHIQNNASAHQNGNVAV